MISKCIQKCMLVIVGICAVLAAGYFALISYYKVKIPYGTWINDIYCTGMTCKEAETALLEQDDTKVWIDVVTCDDKNYSLVLPKETYTVSFSGLDKTLASYGASGIFQEKYIIQSPKIGILEDAWNAFIQQQEFMLPEDVSSQPRLSIVAGENGFVLQDNAEYVLDTKKASALILEAIEAGKKQVFLEQEDCYYKPEYSQEDKRILAEYEALQNFCHRMALDITIQQEVAYTIDWKVLADWILLDADGKYVYDKGSNLILDESKVKEYVAQLVKELTTYWGEDWEFVNHAGDIVSVPAGNFGRVLKTKELEKAILKAFANGETASYELEFSFYPNGASEIEYGAGVGSSYVEVDLSEQHVYLYIDGTCVLDSPCVTGTVSKHMDTPSGVFYIEYKQRNRTLRGEDYATPVSYWMHFYNHCGFHDASWRKTFGGSIYLKNGSHGCVNMPPAKAKELYEQVYAGMPVVIY